MGDLVVNSHPLLKLCVGLLNSSNLLCWDSVGNHDGPLHLAGPLLISLFQFHLDVGSILDFLTADLDSLGDFHILSAGA